MYGTNCLSHLILIVIIVHAQCLLYGFISLLAYIILLLVCIICIIFYVFDFIAHYWATFSALLALLSSRIMTNKDDGDDEFAHFRNSRWLMAAVLEIAKIAISPQPFNRSQRNVVRT